MTAIDKRGGSDPHRRRRSARAGALHANLRLMSWEGIAFGLMVGAGETFIPAFALALDLGHAASGLVASGPLLAGAFLQVLAPAFVTRVGSLRRWTVLCAIVQAGVFAPLVWIAWRGHASLGLLFLLTGVYWGAGLSLSPSWNAWVGQLVPSRLRHRYFARRTSWIQLVVLSGLLFGGAILRSASTPSTTRPFALLFLLAGCARLLSATLLSRQSEPRQTLRGATPWGPADFLRFVRRHADGRILLYMVSAQLAVQIASPYFTAFMLRNLGLGYLQYTVLLSTSFVGKIVTLPLLSRFGAGASSRRLLQLGALGIAPLPLLWLIADTFAELLAVQLLAGSLWAVYELAVLLLQMDMAPAEHRRSVLANLNFFNALAQVSGATLGAALLGGFGTGNTTYAVIFVSSALARAASLLLLRGLPTSDRIFAAVALRVIAVRPSLGAVLRPIHSTFRAERSRRTESNRRPVDEPPSDSTAGGSIP